MSEQTSALGGKRVAFIGGGNMAEALIRGLLQAGCPADRVRASDPAAARRAHLHETYGVQTEADNALLAPWGELVVLAVKPQVMESALASVREQLAPGATVVSIAAGVPARRIEAGLSGGTHVVRAMPNVPALVLAGATAVAAGAHADEADMAVAEALFAVVGRCVRVDERLLDAVTGLSGSGPAYVMMMIDALADGGVNMGLPRPVALSLAAQTVYGAAKMMLETGEHPAALKDRVTSPGGTTIAGVAALEAGGLRSALISAVESATGRAQQLGRG